MAEHPGHLEGCGIAFVSADHADAALDAGVDDVLVCSMTPFATPLAELPPMVLDAALELPVHGDNFGGRPVGYDIRLCEEPVRPLQLDLTPADRVLTALTGPAAWLGVLQRGAALVLLASGDRESALAQESATAWLDEAGLTRR